MSAFYVDIVENQILVDNKNRKVRTAFDPVFVLHDVLLNVIRNRCRLVTVTYPTLSNRL